MANGDGILEELANSPSMMRGMHITLSPGEEYENYEKLNAATVKGVRNSPFFTSGTPSQENEDDDDEPNSHVPKLEHVVEETAEELRRRESAVQANRVGSGALAELSSGAAPAATGALNGGTTGGASVLASKLAPKRMHRLKSVSGHANIIHHVSRMINPLGRFRLAWDVVSIFFIFYNAFVIPVRTVGA